MDVTSLFTNISHDEGIEVCREVLDIRTIQQSSTESLLKLLKHVLKLNKFMFNGENYIQINGTAIGTKMAPSYANILMVRLEHNLRMKLVENRYITTCWTYVTRFSNFTSVIWNTSQDVRIMFYMPYLVGSTVIISSEISFFNVCQIFIKASNGQGKVAVDDVTVQYGDCPV